MLNIGESFRAQQFFGDVCRRVANERAGRDANRGGFWRRLLKDSPRPRKLATPANEAEARKSRRLWSLRVMVPYKNESGRCQVRMTPKDIKLAYVSQRVFVWC